MSRPISFFLKHPLQFVSSFLMKYGKWVPDELYLRIQYRILMGRPLNLRNPKSFTEKIQWLKLNQRTPEMTMMVDKYAVKDYVSNKIGSEYVIPTLGIWNSIESVDWDSLPDQFVLKTTHGGGGTGVVVVKDKSSVDRTETLEKLRWSFNDEGYTRNREWPYKNVPRRIIAEELIKVPGKQDLTDYKVFCFNGEPVYIQVIQDRHTDETIDFYDINWNHQEFIGLNPNVHHAENPLPKPKNLDDMIWAAKELSKGHDFVRVDLYQIEDGILFGELTFFPSSGIGTFTPEKWNLELGRLLHIDKLSSSSDIINTSKASKKSLDSRE